MTSLQELAELIPPALVDLGGSGLDVAAFPEEGKTPPFAHVEFDSWQVESFGRAGAKTYVFAVRVFVAKTPRPQDGYFELLEFLDSTTNKSIELAVWDIDTPISIYVGSARMLGSEEVDGTDLLGAELSVRMVKKGSD